MKYLTLTLTTLSFWIIFHKPSSVKSPSADMILAPIIDYNTTTCSNFPGIWVLNILDFSSRINKRLYGEEKDSKDLKNMDHVKSHILRSPSKADPVFFSSQREKKKKINIHSWYFFPSLQPNGSQEQNSEPKLSSSHPYCLWNVSRDFTPSFSSISTHCSVV